MGDTHREDRIFISICCINLCFLSCVALSEVCCQKSDNEV